MYITENKIKMKETIFAAFCLIALCGCAAKKADNPDAWTNKAQSINRMEIANVDAQAKEILSARGTLATGKSASHKIKLTADRDYAFFADCDYGCTNLDLALQRDGTEVKSDTAADSSPMFGWRARASGRYTLMPVMAACANKDGCGYSVQVFESGRVLIED